MCSKGCVGLFPQSQVSAGPRVGRVLPALQGHGSLAPGVCPLTPLVSKAGLETCVSAYPLVSGAGSWPSRGQGSVQVCVWRWLWAQDDFKQTIC